MSKVYAKFNSQSILETTLIEGLHVIPPDAVEITGDLQKQMINETDGVWTLQPDGSITKEPLSDAGESSTPSYEAASNERLWRDVTLQGTEWLMARHRDERDMERVTTLTAAQFSELLGYRQALREWPQSAHFPLTEHRPVEPAWIAEQIQ